jgi:hypothetical protein
MVEQALSIACLYTNRTKLRQPKANMRVPPCKERESFAKGCLSGRWRNAMLSADPE